MREHPQARPGVKDEATPRARGDARSGAVLLRYLVILPPAAGLALLAAAGCARSTEGCGGRTQAIVHTAPANVDPKPKMVGGFLNIALPDAPKKRCAAHVEFLSLGVNTRALVWTARHCSAERYKDAQAFSLDLFLEGAYVKDLVVKDDFLERRLEALEEARQTPLHADAQKALADAFDVYLGTQSKREDAGCSNEDMANEAREKGLHSVCANWWDLGVYEVRLAAPITGGDLFAKLTKARTEFEAERNASLVRLTRAQLHPARPDLWRQDFLEAWRLQRLKTASSVVRWVEETCDARKPDATTPQAACSSRDALIELAEKFLREDGIDVFAKASELGFYRGGRVATPEGSKPLQELIKLQEGERVIRIQDRWRKYGRKFLFDAKNIHLNTNVTETKAQSIGLSYVAMPLSSIAGSELTLKFVTHGFEYVAPKDKVAVRFQPGDSGSIFSIEGVWPVLALSGVDGEQSSGGASVTALPARRKDASGNGKDTATNGKKETRETAGEADGACSG